MKKSKIRLILLIVASVALIVTLTIGGTLAWLTAKTPTITNTFTVGDINITLFESPVDEKGEITSTTKNSSKNKYTIIPGAEVAKDPTVTVTGGSQACYVYIAVKDELNATIDGCAILDYDFTNWSLVASQTGITLPTDVKVYKYISSVPYSTSKNELPSLFETITFSGNLKNNVPDTDTWYLGNLDGKNILVAAYAHQSDSLGTTSSDTEALKYFENYVWYPVGP